MASAFDPQPWHDYCELQVVLISSGGSSAGADVRRHPTRLFDLPDELPPMTNLSCFQPVQLLERRGFAWRELPRQRAAKAEMAFRPGDPESPRFRCASRAGLNKTYLQALASETELQTRGVVEVQHGRGLAYYRGLLGIEAARLVARPVLQADDWHAEFPLEPAQKHRRCMLPSSRWVKTAFLPWLTWSRAWRLNPGPMPELRGRVLRRMGAHPVIRETWTSRMKVLALRGLGSTWQRSPGTSHV